MLGVPGLLGVHHLPFLPPFQHSVSSSPLNPSLGMVPVTNLSYSLLESLEPGLHACPRGFDPARVSRVLLTIEHSTAPRIVEARTKASQEFVSWLHRHHPGYNLLTCSDEHLLDFVSSHWLLAHCGSQLPDGSRIASPSGLQSMLGHLSTTFELISRASPHAPGHLLGNPTKSPLLTRFKLGYARDQFQAGYEVTLAVPIKPEKVCSNA